VSCGIVKDTIRHKSFQVRNAHDEDKLRAGYDMSTNVKHNKKIGLFHGLYE